MVDSNYNFECDWFIEFSVNNLARGNCNLKINLKFYIKINGEALWKRRKLKMDPTQMFHSLQNGLASFGYKINSSNGVGNFFKRMVYYVIRRVTSETTGEKRKIFRHQ